VEAHEAVLYGHWNEAARILDERIAEAQSGVTHYSDPCCLALRASIALARGDLEAATSDSEWALEGARRIKDPQLLAPALTMRATVQLGQGQWEEASTLASEVLQHGAVLIPALLELHPTVTPIELAWLMRDLGREAEFLSVLELAPSTPWHDAARAIADGDFTHSVELVARIGAPSVDAYTRLRAAEELTRVGWIAGAHDHLEPALDFFRKVGAARYLVLAEALLAAP
jgi:hypothetical protein